MEKVAICGGVQLVANKTSISLNESDGSSIVLLGDKLIDAVKAGLGITEDVLDRNIPCQLCMSIKPIDMNCVVIGFGSALKKENQDTENDNNDKENEDSLREQLEKEYDKAFSSESCKAEVNE